MASTRRSHQSVKLTKTSVDRLPIPASGQTFYRDSELPGFGVRVTAKGVKSFIIEKRVHGKPQRLTLGKYGELTAEQARREAQKAIGQIALGTDPLAEKHRHRIKGLTLAQVFAEFCATRTLKARTLYDYKRLLEVPLGDWKDKQLTSITREMVSRRHAALGEKSGQAYANLTMRFLQAQFNFAIARYEDSHGENIFKENPVVRLTRTRAWFPVKRRQTVIKLHQLPAWWAAVDALRQDQDGNACIVADYLELLLYSGLRREEAARLRWEDVDLKDRTLRIPDPKNRQPHVLPLSPPLVALLTRRLPLATSPYVFAGQGRHGHLIEPKLSTIT
jgi:integrase